MLKKIAITIAVLIAAFLGYAAMQPDDFRTERSTTIDAPPAVIYPLISNFKNWTIWSPYDKKDPNMKRIYGGAESDVGATYGWDGNNEIGAGTMTLTEATPDQRIKVELNFTRPMESTGVAEFTLTPKGEATTVTWAMYGPSPYVAKVMGLIFNMDKMMGNDFEAGLADLKTASEKLTAEAKAITAPLSESTPEPTEPATTPEETAPQNK